MEASSIFMPSPVTEDFDVLLRKLVTNEKVIHGLLRANHHSSVVLKEKLLQLEDLIAHLPEDRNLVLGWHNKVVRWWQQHADAIELRDRQYQLACRNEQPSQNDSQLIVSGSDTQKPISYSEHQMINKRIEPKWILQTGLRNDKVDSVDDSGFGARKDAPVPITRKVAFYRHSSLPPSSPMSSSNVSNLKFAPDGGDDFQKSFHNNSPSGSFSFKDGTLADEHNRPNHQTSEQSREDIINEMERSFARLDVVQSNQDIDSLKQLLLLMAKTRASIQPYRFDHKMQATMFDFAFAKLSYDKRDLFRQTHNRGYQFKLFAELNRFLLLQVSNYYADLKMVDYEQYRRVAKVACDQSTDFCEYCKAIGHMLVECPAIKAMVCFKCFQPGHKAKYCHDPESQFNGRAGGQQMKSSQPLKQSLDYVDEECNFGKDQSPNGSMNSDSKQNCFMCYVCATPGHKAMYCPQRIERCLKCDQLGHVAKFCEISS